MSEHAGIKSNKMTAYILVPHGIQLLQFFCPVACLILGDIWKTIIQSSSGDKNSRNETLPTETLKSHLDQNCLLNDQKSLVKNNKGNYNMTQVWAIFKQQINTAWPENGEILNRLFTYSNKAKVS